MINQVVLYAGGTGCKNNNGDSSLYTVVDDTYIKDVQIYLNANKIKKGVSTTTTLFFIKVASAKHRQVISPQNTKSNNRYKNT